MSLVGHRHHCVHSLELLTAPVWQSAKLQHFSSLHTHTQKKNRLRMTIIECTSDILITKTKTYMIDFSFTETKTITKKILETKTI